MPKETHKVYVEQQHRSDEAPSFKVMVKNEVTSKNVDRPKYFEF